jgi:hypothetical protein
LTKLWLILPYALAKLKLKNLKKLAKPWKNENFSKHENKNFLKIWQKLNLA